MHTVGGSKGGGHFFQARAPPLLDDVGVVIQIIITENMLLQ